MKGKLLLGALIVAMGIGAMYTIDTKEKRAESDLTLANVEALSDDGEQTLIVACYCKKRFLQSTVCSARGSGPYCGGDPCPNHDGNCR